MKFTLSDFSFSKIASEVVESLYPTAKLKRITLEINGPLQPALLTDNKKSFKHVIMPVKTD